MSAIFALANWSKLQGSNDDHWSDRVSHLWTVGILVIFSTLVSSAQYVGDPIQCWCPAHFTGGVNIDRLVELAESTQLSKPEDREKTTIHVAKYLDIWLRTHHYYHFNLIVRVRQQFGNIFCFWFAKRAGKFLIGFYLFVKFLYAANVVFQFFILNKFLCMDYTVYGYEVIKTLVTEGEFKDAPRFPRITLCDFEIRQLENIQRYTVQCVLPINLFNEKIFIFLWFWYLFVAVISCWSYLSLLIHFLIKHNRSHYVKKYLKLQDNLKNETDSKLAKKFAHEYLKDDGIFVLQLVAKNTSEIVVTDLVNSLWSLYKESQETVRPNSEMNSVSTVEMEPSGLTKL
ncbi:unnamed protein product [Candidula unifasciata]|uniref:Innexin n=1 Tax=Candidula unifasciata TaxID=100452 RepID=A0A8S4A3U3_9EUPU|nr:unnamed protein product [Candidula unifasciata]